jgi:general secretion pathway protein G
MLGFTLLEIIVVVAIIAILAGVIAPKILDAPERARIERTKSDIQQIVTALNLYKLDNSFYPSTEQGLDALIAKPSGEPAAINWKAGGYLDKKPIDAWGQPLQYLQPGTHGDVDVYSFGADRKPGGEGNGADLGNW